MSDPEQPNARVSTTVTTFEDLPLNATLRRGVREMGYVEPTPIQQGAIPHAVLGRDLIGTAQTGTGKTAAFLLPILEQLLDRPRGRIHALVLTPTRELALQAESFLKKLGRHTPLRGAAVYGGVGMAEQERALRGGAEIIVATPGRLLDHLQRGYVDLRSLRVLVLDEGDRMLDMGFLPDVRRILAHVPRERQTMLFSATMPPEIVRLSRELLRDPRIIRVDPTTVAAAGVTHRALVVPSERKTEALARLLRDPAMTSVLVFVRTKHRADRLARQLRDLGFGAGVIHGNRSQHQRVLALEGFRDGRHRVLVATDIAARGVDVEGVSHVVNYDLPAEPDIYVHRVGRTARAQRQGDAVSLVLPEERDTLAQIERHLRLDIRREPPLDGGPLPGPAVGRSGPPGRVPRSRGPPASSGPSRPYVRAERRYSRTRW
jgi:ATP-dependent RNA helicase RhlE